jgi:hypothetical protein
LTVSLKNSKYDIRDIQLKQELKCAIKTSIYRICLTFGDSVTGIQLPQEFKVKLENFRNFLEG